MMVHDGKSLCLKCHRSSCQTNANSALCNAIVRVIKCDEYFRNDALALLAVHIWKWIGRNVIP